MVVISGLSLWGSDKIPIVHAINGDIVEFCSNFPDCTSQVAHTYTMLVSFGVGIGLIVMGSLGFVLTSCYNKGRPIKCLACLYWFIFSLVLLTALTLAIAGTVLAINPDIVLKKLIPSSASASQTETLYDIVARVSIYLCISGWITVGVLSVAAISGGCLLKISKQATDFEHNQKQKLYTNETCGNDVV